MATELLCYETPTSTGAEIAGNSPEWQNLHGHHDQTPHEVIPCNLKWCELLLLWICIVPSGGSLVHSRRGNSSTVF